MKNKIVLRNVSKRYGYQWVVQGINLEMDDSKIHGLAGANGSGKSTLVRILSGFLSPSEGDISFISNDLPISVGEIYKQVSLVAPYTDLIQEYSLPEMFEFHSSFKKIQGVDSYQSFAAMLDMPNTKDKYISHFSSGMKQKIQLALAFVSDTPFLLLDEPTSFLDQRAKAWFSEMLIKFGKGRCIVIASNDTFDLQHCDIIVTL